MKMKQMREKNQKDGICLQTWVWGQLREKKSPTAQSYQNVEKSKIYWHLMSLQAFLSVCLFNSIIMNIYS